MNALKPLPWILCIDPLHWIHWMNPQNPLRIHWIDILPTGLPDEMGKKTNWMNPLCTESPESFALNPLHWSFALNPLSRGNHSSICVESEIFFFCPPVCQTRWGKLIRRWLSLKSKETRKRLEFAPSNNHCKNFSWPFSSASYEQLRPFPSKHPLQLAKLKVGSFENKPSRKIAQNSFSARNISLF